MKKILFSAVVIGSIFAACKSTKPTETTTTVVPKPAADCSAVAVTYESDIKAILENNCTGCHGNRPAGGYNFTSMADIQRAAKNGDLLGTIKWEKGFPKMPARAGQLDQATITKIECWVNNGMK